MNLDVLLEDHVQRRIELVTTDALSPYIGRHIMSEVEYAALAPAPPLTSTSICLSLLSCH